MKKVRFTLFVWLVLVASLHSSQAQQSSVSKAFDLTLAKPESVGFSSERLERLHAYMQSVVDQKQLPGMITILERHGKVVDYRTYGYRDLATKSPMTKDVIFRDYSMTKPVTGVAMMILFEQGKWWPMDPISKYIPEFAHLKVFKSVGPDGKMIVEDPDHAPTMRELMSHTAGFTYGIFGNTPVDGAYRDAGVLQSKTLQEAIDKLAKIPLAYQPGKGWQYSVSVDIQGYIVEKLSGQSMPDFMQHNIFKPLGMKDADFFVPPDKRKRFVTMYAAGADGQLTSGAGADGYSTDYAEQPTMASGGGGLVSTGDDYLRFAEMLANGGELNGVRILSPSSVALMTANHVPAELLTGQFGIGLQVLRPGFGYGYDCAVLFDPLAANEPVGKGTFFWDGAAGTWFWVDPTNDIVFVGMIQRRLGAGSPDVEHISHNLVYQALVNPNL
jgi:CubicO group peptidase (beta-lactamase class C family)